MDVARFSILLLVLQDDRAGQQIVKLVGWNGHQHRVGTFSQELGRVANLPQFW